MDFIQSSFKNQNTNRHFGIIPVIFILSLIILSCSNEYNKPTGEYPGKPDEYAGPVLQIDHVYRNVALDRAAWHSSSFDYNLTAQLVTDGFVDTVLPRWLEAASAMENPLKKNEREWLTDHNPVTGIVSSGETGWVQLYFGGNPDLPEIDRIDLISMMPQDANEYKSWTVTIYGSEDGEDWNLLGRRHENRSPVDTVIFPWGNTFHPVVPFKDPVQYRYYKAEYTVPGMERWNMGEIELWHNGKRIEIAGSHTFTSAWMPAGTGEEWVYVDLGNTCDFDKVVLHWIRRAEKSTIQVSGDRETWTNAGVVPKSDSLSDELMLDTPVSGRYVRLLVEQDGTEPCILSEMEVYGKGGMLPVPKPVPAVRDNKLALTGGNWKLCRANAVAESGEVLSGPTFNDTRWLTATVPATVLVSYLNNGAIPDPNFGDNQLMVSESFFLSDFWYRNAFEVPASFSADHVWLNFDGINWKADVYLNGTHVGRIEGAFTRARFDVVKLLIPGETNVLAVKVEKNASPGGVKEQTYYSPDKNGGFLGADNPTFHASIGWDWIPTIRGRNSGIWNDVWLNLSGPVTVENPFVSADLPLPDTSYADIRIEVDLANHGREAVSGKLHVQFGDIPVEQDVTIDGDATEKVILSPETHPGLHLNQPRLWWPAGYGNPDLYPVDIKFVTSDGQVSDVKKFKTGVREMSYSVADGTLKIWVNGKRFTGRGGNWGFSESMLRYRGREYDIAVRYHKDMHFTMIRNWVGQTGDEEFYEACDKYGIMIWQDFWLANPWDGPDPDNNGMFLKNATDFVLKIRNHPSVGLYCGRNEGYPPEILEKGLRKIIAEDHPGLYYIPNSADDVVSGHGPYRAMPVKYYFTRRATRMLHSEMGMPDIVSMESLRKMMPDSALWPQGRMYGLHDFCSYGAQGAFSFREKLKKSYGPANSAEEWVSLAQFINYDGYRAMFEAQSKNRMGLLLWMSHPAWPSLVWQTYDYYFDPTAAYFGCKKASEPRHIQWNPVTDSVEVVNYSGKDTKELVAVAEILNMDGTQQWQQEVTLDLPEDQTVKCMKLVFDTTRLSPVHFVRLRLSHHGKVISENFYLHGNQEDNFTAIRTLPKADIQAVTSHVRDGGKWLLTCRITSKSDVPALMVRLKVAGDETGERILPVLYGDNYFALMPGEEKTIHIEFNQADTRGEKPVVVVSGFNVK
ncbi:MAG: beta-glycosidase [Chlorobi bacterium]|nr:beta-glycosidase [Chlorobiota bacterium]